MAERIRKDESIHWQLSEQEQDEIVLDWSKKVVKHADKVEAVYNERFKKDFDQSNL